MRASPFLAALTCSLLLSPVIAVAAGDPPPPPATEARQPKCPEETEPLPPDLAAWATHATRIPAAATAARLGEAVLPVDRAVDVELLPTRSVEFVARPGNPGGSVARGGQFRLTIPHAGTWRVAVGARAWIEVVVDGKPVESVGHGGGPACSGIRKVVDYALPAGDHVLMLSASDATVAELLVAEKR